MMEYDASEDNLLIFFFVFPDQAIAPYIPTSSVKLSSAIYEMVLYDFLKKDDKVTFIPYTHFSIVPV